MWGVYSLLWDTVSAISVVNAAKQNITLQRNQILGYLQSVKTVYPAAAQLTEPEEAPGERAQKGESVPEKTVDSSKGKLPLPAWDPPVKLDHLTNDQQEAVRKVLRDKCQAFAYNDDDIGCIPSLKMHITLHDTRPMQKTYMSIPKPLHDEVKQYLTRSSKQRMGDTFQVSILISSSLCEEKRRQSSVMLWL